MSIFLLLQSPERPYPNYSDPHLVLLKGRGLENNLPLEEKAASFKFDLKSDLNNIHKESVLVINGLFYLKKKTDFLTVCREPGFIK